VLDDGCTAERTHPEVCVRITDGTIPELVDTFSGTCPPFMP
jgi:hypothetical protein